ncbi:hypothetical protein [Ovoidimarina sediminis]|uniref:hypothetical protein n=1 Tax=Ovoidimarina sediminis TaxID=3079856 RepID=UPI0029111187|nr:hypothetical protein [Rhodophyticola sp. MJ-SS7]MDU8945568.1 hypothetical protein [Rhodophyticola sp. MJ-SS7]
MDEARQTLILACLATALLAACDRRPEVDAALGPPPPGTEYPDLVSTAEILALDADVREEELAANAALEARGDALRGRAAALANGDAPD